MGCKVRSLEGTIKILTHSVGKDGTNARNDVLLVQQLLNQNIKQLGPRSKLSVDGFCGPDTIAAIRDYQLHVLHMAVADGRVDPVGQTLRSLLQWSSVSSYLADSVRATQAIQSKSKGSIAPVDKVAPGGGKNQKFTDNENEVSTQKTVPGVPELVAALKSAWPELTVDGTHLLAAQCMQETGGGKHCYNWNFGNVKSADTSRPHMYLRGVWEVLPSDAAAKQATASKGQAHIATEAEIKKHGWSCPAGSSVIVFQPPSRESRFRAYPSMAGGAADWTERYKKMALRDPKFLVAINAGDCAGFAAALKRSGYYTGSEADYARNMTAAKKKIDTTLGKIQ